MATREIGLSDETRAGMATGHVELTHPHGDAAVTAH